MAKSFEEAVRMIERCAEHWTADETRAWAEIWQAARIGNVAMQSGEEVRTAQSGDVLWIVAKNCLPLRVDYDGKYFHVAQYKAKPGEDPPSQQILWRNHD